MTAQTMSAAVLRDGVQGAPLDFSRLAVEEVTLAPPGAHEVLVDIAYASLCHSDLSVITGDRPRPLPMVLGHEASGRVVEVGSAVNALSVGDHVVFTYVAACGHCRFCRVGRPALCSEAGAGNAAGELVSGGSRLTDASGATLNHHLGISAFANHAVVDAGSLVRVPPTLDLRAAALFGCAITTGVGAVINAAKVQLGQSAAVFGCGGVGLAAILGLKAIGAAPIVVVDVKESQLALAKELGADITLVSSATTAAEIVELTGGGVEHAIDASGSLPAIESAFASLLRGGQLVVVGLPNPTAPWTLLPASLVANDVTVRGSYMGSCVPARDIPRFIQLFEHGRLPVDKLVGTTIPLADIADGMSRLHDGFPGRIVVDLSA
ncbi:MAG: hypothetical protein QOE40_1304 [Actinomycetota bacterium]|nr:hypothetical protein [Actinomycetota bacterium]